MRKKSYFQKKNKCTTLHSRLYRGYFVMAIIIVLFFSAFFYGYVSQILIANEVETLNEQNEVFLYQTDNVLKDLDIVSANINYSSLMQDNLDDSFNLTIKEYSLRKIADLFATINGSDLKADQINLYDLDGNVIRYGMSTISEKENATQQPWYAITLKKNGIKHISTPYATNKYTKSANYTEWFISLYRTCSNQYRRTIGTIETMKRCKSVFKTIENYIKTSDSSVSVYVFNEQGVLIYPYDIIPEQLHSYDYYFSSLSSLDENQSFSNPITHETEYLAFETSTYSNWTYISVRPQKEILKPASHMLHVLLLIAFGFVMFSAFLSHHFSNAMLKPLHIFKNRIKALELSTLGQGTTIEYKPAYAELAELYREFELMSEKLNVSMKELIDTREQEVRSRTLALQTQTNPHFYYNTLSSIMILAEDGKNSDIVQLCKNLSSIMRYITDNSSTLVSISQEIAYVKEYLYCMQVRYQDSLSYTIDIVPSLLDYKIPKLLIQPIVENALKYGTNCLPPWHLSIQGRETETGWKITIKDSGNGFSQAALEKINFQKKLVDENNGIPELHIDGLGIVNVYARWKIFAKDDIIFDIHNTDDGHASVIVGIKNTKTLFPG